jgi:flagellar protein FliT
MTQVTMSEMLIDHYKAIEKSSCQMLDAAMAAQWDDVAQCEADCRRLIAQLQRRLQVESLQPTQRLEKLRIMLRILKTDAQIRRLVEPWQARVERHLQGERQTA